jgi:glycosyltransferase involved in cell wall biosynthesis
MDYMMAAKPVINAVRAGNDMVAESGCGVTISPDCPQATAGAVLKLVNLGQARREEMGRCGQEYVRVNHDYPILARRFLDGIGEKG